MTAPDTTTPDTPEQQDRAADQPSAYDGPLVPISTRVPSDLHRALRMFAAEHGVSIQEIVTVACGRFLDRAAQRAARQRTQP